MLQFVDKLTDCKRNKRGKARKVAKPLSMGYPENRKIFGEKEQTSVTA